ncbi:MAG: BT_2262 family domain-containing protein [Cyclobacteriaceae bacterium]
MKAINKLFGLLAFAVLFVACDEDDTANTSSITYYPVFEVTGAAVLQLGTSEDFSDPGVVATEQGTEIDVTTSFVGRFSGYSGASLPNEVDEYSVLYSAVNVDGFAGTTSRTLYRVDNGDMTTSISGLYSATVVRSTGVMYSDINVLVWEKSPGVFEISHGIGGYYGEGSGFGDGYLARGATVTVNDLATNDFTFGQMQFPIWGNVVDITSMTVNAGAKTITYHTLADFGGEWDITLTQIQL